MDTDMCTHIYQHLTIILCIIVSPELFELIFLC